jgi:hypothetical protein
MISESFVVIVQKTLGLTQQQLAPVSYRASFLSPLGKVT